MMKLTDLAREWNRNLFLCYAAEKDVWQCLFVGATPVDQESISNGEFFGQGKTIEEAMGNYAKMIRGKRLNFGSYKYPEIHQAPEVIAT